jgi:hypothetical protein
MPCGSALIHGRSSSAKAGVERVVVLVLDAPISADEAEPLGRCEGVAVEARNEEASVVLDHLAARRFRYSTRRNVRA